MKTYDLIAFFKPIIDTALVDNGVVCPLGLQQSYQPTQQGPENIQVFMQEIAGTYYGWNEKKDVWNETNQSFDHIETQVQETTFQVGATTQIDPTSTTQFTSRDILDCVAASLSAQSTIEAANAAGIGIIRITAVRILWMKNDYDQNQAQANFDFTVTHRHVTISSTPYASPLEGNAYPV